MSDTRFMRTELLLGKAGMQKLSKSTVMIIGLGAVGGYALEAIARSGVGKLILVDFDIIEPTNINRQILALDSTIGHKKTQIAQKRVLDINPDCQVITKDLFINSDTIDELFEHKADFVIDAIDSLNPKCQLIEALYTKGIPFISSMGAALKSDPSKITLGKLSQTKNCTLAKFIRKRLKKRGLNLSQIPCVSSTEQTKIVIASGASQSRQILAHGRSRNTLGSLPTITAIFGLTIANEVIRRLSTHADRS